MNKSKMSNQTHGFIHYHCSSTEKTSSYMLKTRTNQSIFVQALKYSDPKRKELFGDDQIQSEMDLLKELMLYRRMRSYKLNWNNSLTNFERYEKLKRENKEVFQRKAAINSKKDLCLPRIKKYLLNMKRIITPVKGLKHNIYESNKHNNELARNFFNCSFNSNQLMLRGMRISLKKNSNLDLFLETKPSLNLSLMKKNKSHFNKQHN